jgi:conjugal transfer pilus assembly protein TraK
VNVAMPTMVMGAQIIPAIPNATLTAVVSLKEISRIAIEGAKIANADYRPDAVEATRDLKSGELRVIPPENDRKPINLIVTTDKGTTYTLVLTVSDIPSQTVIIRDNSLIQPAREKLAASGPRITKSTDYERSIKALMVAMSRDDRPSDADVVQKNIEIALWQESRFILRTAYISRSIVGEKFQLINVSPQLMKLAEQEFYRPGVLAVGMDHTELAPGTTTSIYVVRERTDNE